ncbi:MAG: MBOAT family O-acyltransferase [Kiritimatiellia bacterium]|nr:MBOAT family O-acyltransferase [Kiritimatiellia bacterium]
MLYSSWTFFAFFLMFFPLHALLRKTRVGMAWFLAASYVFYGWWNPLYLFLLAYVTLVDYFMGRLMDRAPDRNRLWVTISVCNALLMLGFFKYGPFVTDNLNLALTSLGLPFQLPFPNWALPVGISFFSFQSLTYTIDRYRGRVDTEKNLIRYATFVAMFPQLLAGPIERAGRMLPQLKKGAEITREGVAEGASLFVLGLFKKLALANYLALYADKGFTAPDRFDGGTLLLAVFAYTWQIYFDFSGYSDMARGVARVCGYRLMLNFNHPYLASGLGDFWNRWHISLSTWFKDYLYIPLGGNRRGPVRMYFNIFITMVVSGLWHGAAWTFLIWGALHAAGRFLTKGLEETSWYQSRVPKAVKQAWTFGFVMLTWTFFRATTFADAWLIVRRIFAAPWSRPDFPGVALAGLLLLWTYQFLYESRARRWLEWAPVRVAGMLLMLLTLTFLVTSGGQAFIYFQF